MSETPAPEAVYELPIEEREASWHRKAEHGALPEDMLEDNAAWFCRLRWIVAGFFFLFGVTSVAGALDLLLETKAPVAWPFAVAAALALANIVFLAHTNALRRARGDHGGVMNLWAQIVFDLAVLTAVVHFVGSVETLVACAYLFHIVLACIFFSKAQSLLVVAIASALYLGGVSLESAGVLPTPGAYMPDVRLAMEQAPGAVWLQAGSAVAIWVVLWHLTSRLADMVRDRDRELAETNRQLVEAQEIKTRHMLHTTHELKAPFAAIHANAQLLEKGYCGELPEEAKKAVAKISARAKRLASEIQEMLQLANLRTVVRGPRERKKIDLARLVRDCAAQIAPQAKNRGIVIEMDLELVATVTIADHLQMLLTNLLSNAVNYSKDGGRVEVMCRAEPGGAARLTVRDEGIGIPEDKLPKVFQVHYRTDEAVHHHQESSGLGLAIVSEVAQEHGIRLKVSSRAGVGTTFDLLFPPASLTGRGTIKEEEPAWRTC